MSYTAVHIQGQLELTNSPLHQSQTKTRHEDEIESALEILWYYEGDEYEFLADESVTCELMDNFGYSVTDSRVILKEARTIHQYRIASGFYA